MIKKQNFKKPQIINQDQDHKKKFIKTIKKQNFKKSKVVIQELELKKKGVKIIKKQNFKKQKLNSKQLKIFAKKFLIEKKKRQLRALTFQKSKKKFIKIIKKKTLKQIRKIIKRFQNRKAIRIAQLIYCKICLLKVKKIYANLTKNTLFYLQGYKKIKKSYLKGRFIIFRVFFFKDINFFIARFLIAKEKLKKKILLIDSITKLKNNPKKRCGMHRLSLIKKKRDFPAVKNTYARYLKYICAIKKNNFEKNSLNYITINAKTNNVFFSFVRKIDNRQYRAIHHSAGSLHKMRISKRGYKFKISQVVRAFFSHVRIVLRGIDRSVKYAKQYKLIILNLIVPRHARRKLMKFLFKIFRLLVGVPIIVNFREKRIFNGCKERKAKRKKRKGRRFIKQ